MPRTPKTPKTRRSALARAFDTGQEIAEHSLCQPLGDLIERLAIPFDSMVRQYLRENGDSPANDEKVFDAIAKLPSALQVDVRGVFADYSDDRNGDESATADVAFALGVAYGARLTGGRR